MVNNQETFDRIFHSKKEERTIKLRGEKFSGNLLIKDYWALEKLCLFRIKSIESVTLKNLGELKECTIWGCGINNLVIKNCPQIKKLNLRDNLLTSLDFLKELNNSESLDLDVGLNNFSESDLEPFSRIFRIRKLNIGNLPRWEVLLGRYNHFNDSLIHLRNNNELRGLEISNTDIDTGLEHLPESLDEITCMNDFSFSLLVRRENGCSKIVQKLADYRISKDCYDLVLWRSERLSQESDRNPNEELVNELSDSLDFSMAEKEEQWKELLNEIESQLTSKMAKKIIQQLKNNFRLEETLKLLEEEIDSEAMERLQTIQEELKELEKAQERVAKIQLSPKN